MKTLYESILDDEDEVMDRIGNTVFVREFAKKILPSLDITNMPDEKLKRYIYSDDKGLHIPARIQTWDAGYPNLVSGDMVNEFYSINRLDAFKELKKYNHKPIHIKNVLNLLVEDTWPLNLITIDNIGACYLYINNSHPNKMKFSWINKLNKCNVKTLYIQGNVSYELYRLQESTIFMDKLKNVHVDKLVVQCTFFPDVSMSSNENFRFPLTEKNCKCLDNLFANNKIKEMGIALPTKYGIDYTDVIKDAS